jgi:hypothetical protein
LVGEVGEVVVGGNVGASVQPEHVRLQNEANFGIKQWPFCFEVAQIALGNESE